MNERLSTFKASYVRTAMWSSHDNSDPETGGEPMDDNYDIGDLALETVARMESDCESFFEAHHGDFPLEMGAQRAGHDFWLTRNGHGAGFWDGDWPEPAATRLDEASRAFGECDLYVGDDGLIYLM